MNPTKYGGRRRARPLWRAAVLAFAICAVLPGVAVPPAVAAHRTPEPAPAGVPEGFASLDELFAMQGQMNAAAEAILGPDLSAADGVPAVDRGYASVVAAPEVRELVIYWKGPVPDKVQAAIEEQRRNVPIRVAPATYSAAEMIREVRRIGAEAVRAGARGVMVAPEPDGSGIRVTGTAATRAAVARSLAGLRPAVAVTMVDGDGAIAPANRFDDCCNYYAGARTQATPTTRGCTLGFAIQMPASGPSALLTAGHCGSVNQAIRDGGGQTVGTMVRDNDGRDIGIIQGGSGPQMWDGSPTTTTYKAVQGSTPSINGNWLCTSGSRSGTRCNIRVNAVNVRTQNEFGTIWYPMVLASEQSGAHAMGVGDSGGPVFELPSPDNGKVIAKGGISGGVTATARPCPGDTGRTCYSQFVYADVRQTLGWYGVTLKTA